MRCLLMAGVKLFNVHSKRRRVVAESAVDGMVGGPGGWIVEVEEGKTKASKRPAGPDGEDSNE